MEPERGCTCSRGRAEGSLEPRDSITSPTARHGAAGPMTSPRLLFGYRDIHWEPLYVGSM